MRNVASIFSSSFIRIGKTFSLQTDTQIASCTSTKIYEEISVTVIEFKSGFVYFDKSTLPCCELQSFLSRLPLAVPMLRESPADLIFAYIRALGTICNSAILIQVLLFRRITLFELTFLSRDPQSGLVWGVAHIAQFLLRVKRQSFLLPF